MKKYASMIASGALLLSMAQLSYAANYNSMRPMREGSMSAMSMSSKSIAKDRDSVKTQLQGKARGNLLKNIVRVSPRNQVSGDAQACVKQAEAGKLTNRCARMSSFKGLVEVCAHNKNANEFCTRIANWMSTSQTSSSVSTATSTSTSTGTSTNSVSTSSVSTSSTASSAGTAN